jgi:hypothetical protein
MITLVKCHSHSVFANNLTILEVVSDKLELVSAWQTALSCVDVYGPRLFATPFLIWFGFTFADVYPASECGPMYRRREPQWISACFFLIGSKASAFALPVHTSGLRSCGTFRLTISCQVAAIESSILLCSQSSF